MEIIEDYLEKPYWIIDILPKQVPERSPGQYGAVERYFRKKAALRRKQLNILLKLNCYYDLVLQRAGGQTTNPEPKLLKSVVGEEYLNVLVGGALIVVDHTDTYMTVYGADHELLELLSQPAAAEGLFVWQPEINDDADRS